MVDIPGVAVPTLNTAAIGNAASTGAYYYAVTSLYVMILAGIMILIMFLLYRKTFDIKITILDNTRGSAIIKDGYRGKITQLRPGEFRFKIFNAKRYKFKYNQEFISPTDLYNDVSNNGKIRSKLFMTFDDQGQLVPLTIKEFVTIVHKTDGSGVPMYDHTGAPIMETKRSVQALVKQVDVSYFFKELDKAQELFDHRTFWDKNGWLVIVVVMLITLGVFGYVAYKFGVAANSMGDVVKQQGELIRFLELSRNGTVIPT